MIGAILLGLSTGCTTPSLFKPSRADVIERIVPSAVQIVLERDGQRVRSGSGVAIAARPSARGTECFVLTSGHTLARRSETDRVFVLFDRHRGAGVKAAATVVAHRDTDPTDLALLRAHPDACFPAQFGHRQPLGTPSGSWRTHGGGT